MTNLTPTPAGALPDELPYKAPGLPHLHWWAPLENGGQYCRLCGKEWRPQQEASDEQ